MPGWPLCHRLARSALPAPLKLVPVWISLRETTWHELGVPNRTPRETDCALDTDAETRTRMQVLCLGSDPWKHIEGVRVHEYVTAGGSWGSVLLRTLLGIWRRHFKIVPPRDGEAETLVCHLHPSLVEGCIKFQAFPPCPVRGLNKVPPPPEKAPQKEGKWRRGLCGG